MRVLKRCRFRLGRVDAGRKLTIALSPFGSLATLPAQVIVTSYLFPSGKFALDRLQSLAKLVGKEHLVVDISCRRKDDRWVVAMNKWQDLTDMEVDQGERDRCDGLWRGVLLLTRHPTFSSIASIDLISEYCS